RRTPPAPPFAEGNQAEQRGRAEHGGGGRLGDGDDDLEVAVAAVGEGDVGGAAEAGEIDLAEVGGRVVGEAQLIDAAAVGSAVAAPVVDGESGTRRDGEAAEPEDAR